jgi:hypothetical protein
MTCSSPIPARADPGHLPAAAAAAGSCLGRTCLHWRADGELTEEDRDLVLRRLRLVDARLAVGAAAQRTAKCSSDLADHWLEERL